MQIRLLSEVNYPKGLADTGFKVSSVKNPFIRLICIICIKQRIYDY